MVSFSQEEAQLTMMVVHAKHQHGFFIALVPGSLSADEVDAELRGLGIEATQIFELGNWETSPRHIGVAFVPLPPNN